MGDEDGWGNIVDLLQVCNYTTHTISNISLMINKQQQEKKVRVKKRKEIDGDPLPSWMKKCVYSSSGDDGYEAAEYLISFSCSSLPPLYYFILLLVLHIAFDDL